MNTCNTVAIGILAACLAGCGGQPLEPWHTANLTNEFVASMADEVSTFDDYLALEDRLFEELQTRVYTEVGTGPEYAIVRYSSGSAADPTIRQPNRNRSFELPADEPRGGILLLHGLTDSPYTLHDLGEKLNEQGFWVLGLRLPGHGTAPSALKRARWGDMAAAVKLAMNHLVAEVGSEPIHVVGYSTGATLALDLALNSIDDSNQPMPASLVLISPAVGVSAAAALARPTAAIGRVPGLSGAGWTQITPEFDPYKYNSFPTNAGAQVHQLTRSVSNRVARLAGDRTAGSMPPILVFKSAVDATVSTNAVVDRLLGRLPDNGNELVLFDINRSAWASILLVSDPGPLTERLLGDPSLPFALTLVANENPESASVVAHHKAPFSADFSTMEPLNLAWPRGVISLSHVALPFAPNDPLYGQFPPEDKTVLFLGQLQIRGERGLMKISSDWLLRLRYNPFYPLLEQRVLEWVGVVGP
jgi:alpha-beta hydrolase superfamily lysophospholipase